MSQTGAGPHSHCAYAVPDCPLKVEQVCRFDRFSKSVVANARYAFSFVNILVSGEMQIMLTNSLNFISSHQTQFHEFSVYFLVLLPFVAFLNGKFVLERVQQSSKAVLDS